MTDHFRSLFEVDEHEDARQLLQHQINTPLCNEVVTEDIRNAISNDNLVYYPLDEKLFYVFNYVNKALVLHKVSMMHLSALLPNYKIVAKSEIPILEKI